MVDAVKKGWRSFRNSLRTGGQDVYESDYEEYDDEYEDEYEYEETSARDTHTRGRSASRTRYTEEPERTEASPRTSAYKEKVMQLGYAGTHSAGSQQASRTPSHASAAIPSAIIVRPNAMNDSGAICKDICDGRMVVLDLSALDSTTAQRIADYLGGVVHAIQGSMTRINKSVIAVAPYGFEVAAPAPKKSEKESDLRDYGAYKAVR